MSEKSEKVDRRSSRNGETVRVIKIKTLTKGHGPVIEKGWAEPVLGEPASNANGKKETIMAEATKTDLYQKVVSGNAIAAGEKVGLRRHPLRVPKTKRTSNGVGGRPRRKTKQS